jgi:hypothetical protein
MKAWKLAAAATLLAIGAASTTAAKQVDKDFQQSFDVQQGVNLILEHGDGDVTIEPWEKDVIDVAVRYHIEYTNVGVGSQPDLDVEFEQSGNTVRVLGREKGSVSIGFHTERRLEYTYTIQAPSYTQLELRGDDGSVSIHDWAADIDCTLEDGDVDVRDVTCDRVDLEISDGDVRLEGLRAQLSIDAEDGDVDIDDSTLKECRIDGEDGAVTVRRSAGDFEIDVEDGDVELQQVSASRLTLRADDGSLDLDLLGTDHADWDIETEDGDVSIRMAAGTSADVSITSQDGRIRLDLPDEQALEKTKHSASGKIHGGQGRIRVRTGDGDVTLREAR